MAFQPLSVISYLSHPCRGTVETVFNPSLGDNDGSHLSRGYLSESDCNSATGIRIRLL